MIMLKYRNTGEITEFSQERRHKLVFRTIEEKKDKIPSDDIAATAN
jgi:hypothetical protein